MELRPAQKSDQKAIEVIIHAAQLNPMGLDWRHFWIAGEAGVIAGVGQIKPHQDGSRELASIAVIPSHRGRGIASQIIRTLLEQETGPLYLMCRDALESFYEPFGFRRIGPKEMTPYFSRIYRLARIFMFTNRGVQLVVMKKTGTIT